MASAGVVARRAGLLVRACHPAPTAAVTVLSVALFSSAGNTAARCAIGGLAVLAGQLSIGWSNDLIDRERDVVAGRTDKPLASGGLSAAALGTATALAVLASIPLSLALGWPAGVLHLAAVAAGWAYNLWLKFRAVSPLPYLVAFAALPVIATLSRHRQWPAAWVVAAAGLVGVAAHFANVLPDLDSDARTGVRGLPQRLGFRRSALIAAALVVLVAVLVLLARPGPLTAAGLLTALVLAAITRRAQGNQAFVFVMLAGAADLAVVIGSGGLR
ncbi:MAG TPA: UbiA family prenyltransferase [Jatrophihabitans sp.]|nr:UbiA family prenyltransferase [Jatrophihabitans sp.]